MREAKTEQIHGYYIVPKAAALPLLQEELSVLWVCRLYLTAQVSRTTDESVVHACVCGLDGLTITTSTNPCNTHLGSHSPITARFSSCPRPEATVPETVRMS